MSGNRYIRIYETTRNSNRVGDAITRLFRVPLPQNSQNRGLDEHIFGSMTREHRFTRCRCRRRDCGLCNPVSLQEHEGQITPDDGVERITINISNHVMQAIAQGSMMESQKNNVSVIPELTCEKKLDTDCGICLCPIKKNDKFRALPCSETHNHCFHTKCVDEWLKNHNTCPSCRSKVL